jgi:hypothetical protein
LSKEGSHQANRNPNPLPGEEENSQTCQGETQNSREERNPQAFRSIELGNQNNRYIGYNETAKKADQKIKNLSGYCFCIGDHLIVYLFHCFLPFWERIKTSWLTRVHTE